MFNEVKQGFYKIIKDDIVLNYFLLNEENIFICSNRIRKLTDKQEIEEAIANIKKTSRFFEKELVIQTIATNLNAEKKIEKHGIVYATFAFHEMNNRDIRGIINQFIHIKYPLTGRERTHSYSYVIK